MASLLGNYFGNQALNRYFINIPTWLALHTLNPGPNGDLGTEVTGGGYARQKAQWSAPANKTIATTNSQTFHDLPATTVRYLAVWDAVEFGDILILLPLGGSGVSVPAAGQFIAQVGDVAFTI